MVPNTRDWKPGAALQVLVFGESKSGKTFGALTFPRPVVLDFDKGIATVASPQFIAKHGRREIEYEQFTEKGLNDLGVVRQHNAFDDACRYFDKMMKPPARDTFDTWIVDSCTVASELAMNKAICLLGDKNFATDKAMSQTHAQALKHGLVFPKIQDYGSERSLIEQFVQMVKDSGKHVVIVCHEKVETDKQGMVTRRMPLLTGKGVEAVMLKFDEIYNLYVSSSRERILLTQDDGIRKAGSRYGITSGSFSSSTGMQTTLEWSYPAIVAELEKIRSASQPQVKGA